jgi:hypothetical protein
MSEGVVSRRPVPIKYPQWRWQFLINIKFNALYLFLWRRGHWVTSTNQVTPSQQTSIAIGKDVLQYTVNIGHRVDWWRVRV